MDGRLVHGARLRAEAAQVAPDRQICVLFAPLVIVKYAYFLAHDVLGLVPVVASAAGDVSFLKFALPLGISFVTFTLTAYVVDIYAPVSRGFRFSTLLGYVLFFPHLIAGPILRPNELMSQLRAKRRAMDAASRSELRCSPWGW